MNKRMKVVMSINSIAIGLIASQLWIDFGFEQFVKYGLPFVVLTVTNGLVLLGLMKGRDQ